MFTPEEATEERVADYVDALETEKHGLQERIRRLKDGRPDPVNATVEVLQLRVKDVDTELKRVGKLDTSAEEAKDDEPAGPETVEQLLELTRAELNAKATDVGVAEPDKLPNKEAVAEAIVAAGAAGEA